jgi:hypothetical protein
MTEREQVLYDWLHQACALLAVEARDHHENRMYDDMRQQRDISRTLRDFIQKAVNVMDDAKQDAS